MIERKCPRCGSIKFETVVKNHYGKGGMRMTRTVGWKCSRCRYLIRKKAMA